jgi:hypothetical protein
MSVLHPIDAAILADYWLAALGREDEDAVEEHLLDCDGCGARLRDVIALVEGVRHVAREGTLRMIVSDAFLARAEEEGLRVRQYAAAAGGAVQCTVTADDDILVARLAADLSAAGRVDLCIYDERGVELHRMADIPLRSGADSVVYQEAMASLKAAPTFTMIARLLSIDDLGAERTLGEYTFNHTRTLPGPGAW